MCGGGRRRRPTSDETLVTADAHDLPSPRRNKSSGNAFAALAGSEVRVFFLEGRGETATALLPPLRRFASPASP